MTQRVEQDDPTRVRQGSASQCVIRLLGALPVEINDEMIAAERPYIATATVTELTDHNVELASPGGLQVEGMSLKRPSALQNVPSACDLARATDDQWDTQNDGDRAHSRTASEGAAPLA